jgi:hypothetical protein
MQVSVILNGCFLTALLDSGSTHNFVDTTAAERVGLRLQTQSGLRIAVANEDRIANPGCYRDLQIMVDGEPFYINCFGLALSSYDMVLDV